MMMLPSSFLHDLINEFSFDYESLYIKNVIIDDNGNEKKIYEKAIVSGSLQTEGGKSFDHRDFGVSSSESYKFYTKQNVKLNRGDYVLFDSDNILTVTALERWDNFGVRIYSLQRVSLEERREIDEIIKHNTLNFTDSR